MGYFEGLASGSFKTTPDGRWLFFPWGVLGRGYSIAAEEDYQRLRRQIKIYMMVALVLIIGGNLFAGYAAGLVMAAILCGFYLSWMWSLLPRLKSSGEKLSLQESMTSQARAHGAFVLWAMEIAALVLTGGGVAMFVMDPDHRLIAVTAIAFFGLCLAKISHMLFLQRRTTDVP
jgi:hypothetical protein